MGKSGKRKKRASSGESESKKDGDTAVFIQRAQEFKEEGSQKFKAKDFTSAIELYERALRLLPEKHPDTVFLHSNIAVCLMQIEPLDYQRVIGEYNLALEVNPRYKKALLRRAKAYESVGDLDLAFKDFESVLQIEPNDKTALEAVGRLKAFAEKEQDKEALIEAVNQKSRNVKLVFEDDIRLADMPVNCELSDLREIIRERYPTSKAVLVKYRDPEGDLITITSTHELRLAETYVDAHEFLRLYVVEVDPKLDPFFNSANSHKSKEKPEDKDEDKKSDVEVDKWVYEFIQLFKSHLGIDPEGHINLQEVGMDFCTKALEDAATSEAAQHLFEMAENKFQEIAALALFNLGNVHMCAATKRIPVNENSSTEDLMKELQAAYSWARTEYEKAGKRYEEALCIKPDFYEGLLALGQELFESAKLSWSLAIATNADLKSWDPSETLEFFEAAEERIKEGIHMWEKLQEQRLRDLAKPFKSKKKCYMVCDSDDENGKQHITEVVENTAIMRSQVNLFWGNVLFERSHIEFKLGIPTWKDHMDSAVDHFKLAGASPTDIAVVIKNHSSNSSSAEGLGFNIDEIVQAWNEMCEAKRFVKKCSSFRLEPLFRRRVPRLHQILEHIQIACH